MPSTIKHWDDQKEVGGVHSTYETFHKCTYFGPRTRKGTAYFGYPAVNMIILKWIAKTWFGILDSGVMWQ
jgi:hypothetical protein